MGGIPAADLQDPDGRIIVDLQTQVELPLELDGGPPVDGPRCGNGRIDGDETCDPLIAAHRPGACPLDLAACKTATPCSSVRLEGDADACSARCVVTPTPNCCGNGKKEQAEQCDDGNSMDSDSCTNDCELPGGHLLLTEIAVSPTEAEFIEVFNPGESTIDLSSVYLSDRDDYYALTAGPLKGIGTDFVVRFPDGATIAPGAFLVIARDANGYQAVFGSTPDFEWQPNSDNAVPDLVAPFPLARGALAGLTDAGELLVLFRWDGNSDLVQDLDYVVWTGSTGTAMVKDRNTCFDGPDADTTQSCYLLDTPVAEQRRVRAPASDGSLHRCNYLEAGEHKSGGNGETGHNETSEPLASTWASNKATAALRTPGGPPPVGLCQ